MARKKQYNETEVIDKAMNLFWRNGYEATSVRMLEKEMGINQFSIYSSFTNKQGVFLECVKTYKKRLKRLTDALVSSENGVAGIKQHFYNFIDFTTETDCGKGCLIVNTANELGANPDPCVLREVEEFVNTIKSLFIANLKQELSKSEELVAKQANYLMISMMGLSNATKLFSKPELQDYVETTFERL